MEAENLKLRFHFYFVASSSSVLTVLPLGSGAPRRRRIARALFARVYARAQAEGLTSDEHFSVDGTLIEAWASQKSFRRKDGGDDENPRGWDAMPGAISMMSGAAMRRMPPGCRDA